MKLRHILTLVSAVMLPALLLCCKMDPVPQSHLKEVTISINVNEVLPEDSTPPAVRTILPEEDVAAWTYDGTAERDGFEPLIVTDHPAEQPLELQLAEGGPWTITIDGKDESGNVILSGTASVTISLIETNTVTIDLHPVMEGTGSILVSFSFPLEVFNPENEGYLSTYDTVTGTLTPETEDGQEPQTPVPLTFTVSPDVEEVYADSQEIQVPAGNYTLSVEFSGGEVAPYRYTESVQIYNNLRSYADRWIEPMAKTELEPVNEVWTNTGVGGIVIRWYDESYVNTGFVIERAPWDGDWPGTYAVLAEIPDNFEYGECKYTDTTALEGVEYTYRVASTDGETVTEFTELGYQVSWSRPEAPSDLYLAYEDDSGQYSDDRITSVTSGLTIHGRAPGGYTVWKIIVFEGETELGYSTDIVEDSVSGMDATWSLDVDLPGDGVHTLHAVCEDYTGDYDGIPGNRSDPSAPLEITIDTTAPEPPEITGPEGTTDSTVTWSWTTPQDAVKVWYQLIERDSGPILAGEEQTSANYINLSPGTYHFHVMVEDAAGHSSENVFTTEVTESRGLTVSLNTVSPEDEWFEFFVIDAGEEYPFQWYDVVLDKAREENSSLALRCEVAGASSYKWLVDGVEITAATTYTQGDTCTIDSAAFSIGSHTLSVRAWKDGRYYSPQEQMEFTVLWNYNPAV